jgi:DNA-binding transcriptional ArsR family regulator
MAAAAVDVIGDTARAGALLHPLRLRIVESLRQPDSASGIARRLRLPRQMVNYHVRELARAGYLRRAGQRRVRSMIERRFVATAQAYVLAPSLLGGLSADRRRVEDAFSIAYLLALTAGVQSDLARVKELAEAEGKRVSTLSLSTRLRFESAEQRAEFARALQQAIVDVVGRYASPDLLDGGAKGHGRAYRLVLGCYPAPPDEKPARESARGVKEN